MSDFYSKLRSLFPSDRFYEDAARITPYVSDGLTVFRQEPKAVVMPINNDEVIETLKLCHEFEIPFVARGSGTSLSGGSLPVSDGIVISLNRLNQILDLDPDNRIARVQPGVINSEISAAGNIGCLNQIEFHSQNTEKPVPVVHTVELLDGWSPSR